MSIGVILVGAALILGAVAYIARPLFERPSQQTNRGINTVHSYNELTTRQEAIVALIRELDADQATGKVNLEDYQALRDRYVAEGVVILKQLDALSGQNGRLALDEQIEAQVLALRQTGTQDQEPTTSFCTECGHPADAADQFCAHCGTALQRTVTE
jgi:hypothetical protein